MAIRDGLAYVVLCHAYTSPSCSQGGCAGMDEQKVEASMIAARVPQVEPALADAEEFPSLGSQPAAAAPTPAEPNPSTIPSPAQSVPSSSAQVPLTPAALVNIQLYILPQDGTASNPAVSPEIAPQRRPSSPCPYINWSQWEACRMTFFLAVGVLFRSCTCKWCLQNGAQTGQARSAEDDDVMAGGLGMFEGQQGKDESWTAPQSMQKPMPKKLTGPWGDYGVPASGSAAQKAGKKRAGNSLLQAAVLSQKQMPMHS